MARKTTRYGWTPDLPDERDHTFRPTFDANSLPTFVDLRPKMPDVYDQGQAGSCTANAIAAALEYQAIAQGEPVVMPSRLFIYYNERAMEHTTRSDSGAMIRDGIKVVNKLGCCPETEWPYDLSQLYKRPTLTCYADAVKDEALAYQRVMRDTSALTHLKTALASGLPVVFGFSVYESFESSAVARTGVVTLPKSGEAVIGGHAVLAVGYDTDHGVVICRNSWGPDWGDAGYFYMPVAYLSNPRLSSDFWAVSRVS